MNTTGNSCAKFVNWSRKNGYTNNTTNVIMNGVINNDDSIRYIKFNSKKL